MPCSAAPFNVLFSKAGLPPVEQLLISGGDQRIALDPLTGRNKYGCQPLPDPALLAFASSTASVISTTGFIAACQLRERLLQAGSPEYALEMERIRGELLSDVADPEVKLVFASSGTDVHAMAARLSDRPLTVVMVEESETGSGVAAAIATDNKKIHNIQLLTFRIRKEDGTPRALADIDDEVTGLVDQAAATGNRVLLILADQTKTGLIAPGIDCALRLRDRADILVDACQFRIAPPTLRAYLKAGFMVAITGSKFLTGPAFSAALLFPAGDYIRFEGEPVNIGLLLRWEAALAEFRRFRAVPEAEIIQYFQMFVQAVQERLANDAHFESLPAPPLDRHVLNDAQSWDQYQSIFSFVLYRPRPDGTRVPLDRNETLQVYRQLSHDACQLGQPVPCGRRDGVEVSALRLCLSARLISDAAGFKGISGVIDDAMVALDKVAQLIDR